MNYKDGMIELVDGSNIYKMYLGTNDIGDNNKCISMDNNISLSKFYYKHNIEIIVIDRMSCSDYTGASYTLSNQKCFIDEFGEVDGVYELYGSYSYVGVAIRADLIHKEIFETICALEDYPIIDDDHHSELEIDMQNEAWEETTKDDFKNEIEKHLNIELELEMDDEKLWELFRHLQEITNKYWINECNNMYFHVEDLMCKCDRDLIIEYGGTYKDDTEE